MTRARDLADYISTGVSDTELDVLDGVTAGTVTASKALVVDANKDVASLRNITATGTITGNVTGDITGNVTGNVSGSSGSTTGNAATATALATARNIGGVSFDGTAAINLPGVNTAGNQNTSGNAATATTAGTVTTAAQSNITSLGTLTALTVDDITIDGSTISDGGTLTIDVAGKIDLSADDEGNVRLFDGTLHYGTFKEASNNFIITSQVSDADLIFQGNDGGSTVTALTLDMSEAGKATFNSTVQATGFNIGGTAITSTAAELNILDGVTATTAELNYNDITTLGTSQASKVVTADANGDVNLSEELKAKSYNETYVSLSAGSTVDIDNETGNVFALTTNQNTTFTFSNPPASGTSYGFTLKLTAGGSHTITYPNSVDFAGGTAPDAPASGETDVLVFFTVDGGTNWYGAIAIDAAG